MYILPQPHVCAKGHRVVTGPHDGAIMVDGKPVCPVCLTNFYRETIGLMEEERLAKGGAA